MVRFPSERAAHEEAFKYTFIDEWNALGRYSVLLRVVTSGENGLGWNDGGRTLPAN